MKIPNFQFIFFIIVPMLLSLIPSSHEFSIVVTTHHHSQKRITRITTTSKLYNNSNNNPNENNYNNRFDKDLELQAEYKAREKSKGSGTGELAAGAILGGLVLGPFGALFGASLGSSLGASRALDKAKKDELDKMGISEDMLQSAREIGIALERSVEGLKATQDSLFTQQRFASRLDEDAERVYDQAKQALNNGDEETAKTFLLKRVEIQEKLKKTLLNCAEEKKRLQKMEENVRAIEERAIEIESLMKRNMGAKALLDSSSLFSLADEDPLIQKFRDL